MNWSTGHTWQAKTMHNTFWNLSRGAPLWSSMYGVLRERNQNWSLSLSLTVYFFLSGLFFLSLCSSPDHSQPLCFQLLCPDSHGLFSLTSPFLFLSLHLCSTPSPFSCSVFPFSFRLSHLVTRPLERSVEFPLSQRRGQSEPHKDPQWTPSALSSLHSVTAAAHTETDWII